MKFIFLLLDNNSKLGKTVSINAGPEITYMFNICWSSGR